MNNEKEIEKMRPVLYDICCQSCMIDNIAYALIAAGYGNVKQAVKEFAEKLKMRFSSARDELDFYIAVYNFSDIKRKIDNLITELYGEENT